MISLMTVSADATAMSGFPVEAVIIGVILLVLLTLLATIDIAVSPM